MKNILKKIAKILNENSIPYMIIGGQAVLLYGIPRLTDDIDVTLGIDINNFPKIKKLFRKMNLSLPKNIDDSFIEETFCLVGIDKKTGIRVDFIFSFTPYEKEAINCAKIVKLDGVKVRFASVEDLIIHKLFAKRERDIEDIKLIIKKHEQKVDIKYIREKLKYFVAIEDCEDIIERFNALLEK